MCTPSRNSNSVKVIHFCFIKNRDENSERLQVIIDICKYIMVEKKKEVTKILIIIAFYRG